MKNEKWEQPPFIFYLVKRLLTRFSHNLHDAEQKIPEINFSGFCLTFSIIIGIN